MATKPDDIRRSPVAALLYGAPIGLLGGLIGLGGAEFRLPVLAGVFGYVARRGVALNLAVSLVTVVSALVIRGGTLSLTPLLSLALVVASMIAGAVSAAYVGTALVHRISEHLLERVVRLRLWGPAEGRVRAAALRGGLRGSLGGGHPHLRGGVRRGLRVLRRLGLRRHRDHRCDDRLGGGTAGQRLHKGT